MMELYVTVGRGLDVFAEKHLEQLGAHITQKTEGKLAFSIDDVSKLTSIKFVERLFGTVDISESSAFTKSDLLNHLHQVLSSKDRLKNAVVQLKSAKRQKLDDDAITFRLSIKATGKWKKRIDVSRLSKDLSAKVASCTGWSSDLRNATTEICIHVGPAFCAVGIPVFRNPLSCRSYLKHPGLRSTVCDAMISLAELESDSCTVLDITCGNGTLLFEAAAAYPQIYAIGCDKNADALATAKDNLAFCQDALGRKIHVDFMRADTTNVMLRVPSDRIIADLPFGQQHCTAAEIATLYPLLVKSISRWLLFSCSNEG
uniref:UPF0020 domain-containing protein n=1 Tax=Plectus sambesii TaxID=2011161 RepID=A0A914XG17_9BILA